MAPAYTPYRTDTVSVDHDGPVTIVADHPARAAQRGGQPVRRRSLRQAFVAVRPGRDASPWPSSPAPRAPSAPEPTSRRSPKATAGPSPTTGPGPMGPTRLTLSKPVIAAVEGFAVAGGHRAGAVVRPAGGGRGRRLRRVLPALRRARCATWGRCACPGSSGTGGPWT